MDNPGGQRDVVETPSKQADTWLGAIRGLRDNPLAQYMPVMARRAAQPARRTLLLRIVLTLVALTVLGFITHHALRGSGISATEHGIYIAAVLVLPAFAVFYFRGLFMAFQACLSALNRHSGAQRAGLVEELAGSPQLTDREIIVGLGQMILPVLVRRVVAAAVVIQTVDIALIYLNSALPRVSRPGLWLGTRVNYADVLVKTRAEWLGVLKDLLGHAPLAMLGITIFGIFAAMLWFLWLLALGRRRISPGMIGTEAALLALFQLLSTVFCWLWFIQSQNTGIASEIKYLDSIVRGLEGLMLAGLWLGSSWMARRTSWQRNMIPVGMVVLLSMLAVQAQASFSLFSRISENLCEVTIATVLWLSAVCIGNPLANPVITAML